MLHSVQYNFDTSMFQAVSPFEKNTIVDIYSTVRNICINSVPCDEFYAGEISVSYVGCSSSYTLDEFKKHFSNSDKYTSLQFGISCLPRKLLFVFVISPSEIFFNIESNVLTKAELEDLRDEIIRKTSPFIDCGKRLQPIRTTLDDAIDCMFEKAMSLPVVGAAGNALDDNSFYSDQCNNPSQSSNPSNKKTPFYKIGVFWGAVGALATIASLIAGIFGRM